MVGGSHAVNFQSWNAGDSAVQTTAKLMKRLVTVSWRLEKTIVIIVMTGLVITSSCPEK